MPVEGGAAYVGSAGGLYAYEYGSNWGELQGTTVFEEYEGIITLRADFSQETIQGCIGCEGDITIRRSHLRSALGWRPSDPPEAAPTDYEVHFGPAPFNPDGTFESTDVTVTHPERTITQSGGYWGGQFSNRPDRTGNPRLVAGFSEGEFAEADGSNGALQAIFNALSEPFRTSGTSQGP